MLNRRYSRILVAAIFTLCVGRAEVINVTINTSSLSGQNGGIYFQFAPGLNADAATVAIQNFQIAAPGALLPLSPLNFSDGGATGSLDANNLLLDNSFALNDHGEALKFGGLLSFLVNVNIPSVLSGDSGSELIVQVTGPDLLTPFLTSDPNGNLVVISYDQTRALNAVSTSSAAVVSQSSVPEPSSLLLVLSGWAAASASTRQLRRKRQRHFLKS